MRRYRTAQTLGSLAVFGSFAAAEGAARYLDAAPASPLAWYLNLEVFGPFEAARLASSPLHVLSGPHALGLHAGILVLVVGAHVAGARLTTALFSNLALVAAAMLAHAWFVLARDTPVASLAFPDLAREPDVLLLALVLASAAACASSHLAFAGEILAPPPVRPGRDADERL